VKSILGGRLCGGLGRPRFARGLSNPQLVDDIWVGRGQARDPPIVVVDYW